MIGFFVQHAELVGTIQFVYAHKAQFSGNTPAYRSYDKTWGLLLVYG
jgi:hypothetical protein